MPITLNHLKPNKLQKFPVLLINFFRTNHSAIRIQQCRWVGEGRPNPWSHPPVYSGFATSLLVVSCPVCERHDQPTGVDCFSEPGCVWLFLCLSILRILCISSSWICPQILCKTFLSKASIFLALVISVQDSKPHKTIRRYTTL